MSLFADRRHAGQVLTRVLGKYAGRTDVVILALPRGGVPVAYEVAKGLGAPLDVFVVRKLGVPGFEELAMGALASGGLIVLNEAVIREHGLSPGDVMEAAGANSHELIRRDCAYRGDRPPEDVSGKTVILIDDGLATGSTMRAAIQALRQRNPARIIAAVPVAAPEACSEMSEEADDVVCAVTPQPFYAVGLWYEDFPQSTDEEVRALLDSANRAFRERRAIQSM